MNTDEIMALAREVGATRYTNRHYHDRPFHTFSPEQLARFAALVRNAALEEAVEVCDVLSIAEECVTAIRAMKEQQT